VFSLTLTGLQVYRTGLPAVQERLWWQCQYVAYAAVFNLLVNLLALWSTFEGVFFFISLSVSGAFVTQHSSPALKCRPAVAVNSEQ
jgi:hypothetical protein